MRVPEYGRWNTSHGAAMFKRERVKCSSISAAARLRRARVISCDLRAVLARVSRPTQAEIKADKYEGSEPIQQWLDRGSRKYD